jgi:signal transduction histidine kinase
MSNQLMVIAGNLELLRMKLPEEPKLRSYLELAVAAVDRCEALAEQLGALARGPDSRT